MKISLLALAAVAGLGVYTQSAAQAQYYNERSVVLERGGGRDYRDGDDRRERFERRTRRHRTKTVYVIENGRPVQRVVFVDERGRYFREDRGERIFIRERVFESYPTRYFHRDGRPRVGITLQLP